jgi:hypothetical protein
LKFVETPEISKSRNIEQIATAAAAAEAAAAAMPTTGHNAACHRCWRCDCSMFHNFKFFDVSAIFRGFPQISAGEACTPPPGGPMQKTTQGEWQSTSQGKEARWS